MFHGKGYIFHAFVVSQMAQDSFRIVKAINSNHYWLMFIIYDNYPIQVWAVLLTF
jgi:hypothetical protein